MSADIATINASATAKADLRYLKLCNLCFITNLHVLLCSQFNNTICKNHLFNYDVTNPCTPKLRTAAVEVVKDYVIGLYLCNFFCLYFHQLGVSVELDILRLVAVRSLSEVFKLRLIYVA